MIQEIPAFTIPTITNSSDKKIDYQYDQLSNTVYKVYYQAGKSDQFYMKYAYDADNRLKNVMTSSDSIIWDKDADYFYYPHGPVYRTELGKDKVQGIDYVYTLQGWLKEENGVSTNPLRDPGDDGNVLTAINKTVGRDAVGFALDYNKYDYSSFMSMSPELLFEPIIQASPAAYDYNMENPLYNGNIRGMITMIKPFYLNNSSTGSPVAQMFVYDQLNRLKESNSHWGYNNATNAWNSGTLQTDYKMQLSYYGDGNIHTLARSKQLENGTNLMDNLSYTYYDQTNRLKRINDEVTTSYPLDLENQTATSNYIYYNDGNLKADLSESMTTSNPIRWNVYNKMTELYKGGLYRSFNYDAGGNRIFKSNGNTITIMGSFIPIS